MYREAREEARRLGISFAELVRRAIAQTVRHPTGDKPWMRHAGTIAGGMPDDSANVDVVVYGREHP